MKLLIQTMKNIVISPLLLVRAIIAGVAGIAYEFATVVRRDYNPEHLTLVIVILLEILTSVGMIFFAPSVLHTDKSFVCYTGAGVSWLVFAVLYSLIEKEYKTNAEGDTIWNYLGDTAPLFVLATDTVSLLVSGIIM